MKRYEKIVATVSYLLGSLVGLAVIGGVLYGAVWIVKTVWES